MISIAEASKKFNLSIDQISKLLGILLINTRVSKTNTLYVDEEAIDNYLSSRPPFYHTCLGYPSEDYILHSFGNELCSHIDNKSKLCEVKNCPLINLEKLI